MTHRRPLADNPLGVMVAQAFPGPGNSGVTAQGDPPAGYLLAHLERVVAEGFGAIELTRLLDPELRRRAAELVRGVEITFGAYVTQLVNAEGLHPFDLAHPDETHRRRAVDRLQICLHEADQLGARRVGLMSGRDPLDHDLRPQHRDALVRSLVELAADTDAALVLMAFDRCIDPDGFDGAFKGALVGPTAELCEVVRAARQQGADQVWAALDTAHLHENGEGPDHVATSLDVLGYLHVSNCVVDPATTEAAARLGDRHPRFGCPGAEVGLDLLAEHVRVLDGRYGGPIVFEVRPIGDEDPWTVLNGARKAWVAAVAAAADHPSRRS
jgi:sugar phosphate isomerase/epimerase